MPLRLSRQTATRGLLCPMSNRLKGYPLTAFFLCFAAYTTAQMDLALFGYAIPSIRAEFGLSLSGVTSIVSAAFVIGGVLIVWLALLADRIGRKKLFMVSMVGSSVLVALQSIVAGPVSLAAVRGASIATGGLTYPVTGAILSEEFPARIRGLFLGFLQAGYPLGWALASVAAAIILQYYNWRLLFLVGLVSIPLVWLVHRYLREPQRAADARVASTQRASLRELFLPGIRRRTILLFSAQFFFVWAYAGSIFLFPSYLNENRGFESFDFSLIIGVGNAVGILGYVLAAVVGEFFMTRRNTVILWTLLGAIMFQVLIWATDGLTEILIVYSIMSMFFYGSAAVKFAYLAEVFPTRLRATALATSGSLAVTLGSATGPMMVAYAVESFGWNIGYAFVVGLPLVGAAILYTFLTPIPSGMEIEDVETLLANQ